MKKNFFLILILVVSQCLLLSQVKFNLHNKTNFCKSENCGIVEGQIVDFETNKKVEEKFVVAVSKCQGSNSYSNDLILYTIHSNDEGKFTCTLTEGEYCLVFFPVSKLSKYHGDPYALSNPDEANHISVRRGLVTNVTKKVRIGGSIKLNFVSLNGVSVDLNTVLPDKTDIIFNIKSDKITPLYSFIYRASTFEECRSIENAAYNLSPGIYQGIVHFSSSFDEKSNIGYGSQIFTNIVVNAGEVTEANVIFDKINHKSGITGKVKNANGMPFKNVIVKLFSENSIGSNISFPEFQVIAKDLSNENGEFRIVGLHESNNPFTLLLYFKKADGNWIKKSISNINIKMNTIILKNITLASQ